MVRCSERRGGTPEGERAALQREPRPLAALPRKRKSEEDKARRMDFMRLPAFRFLFVCESMIRKSGYRFSEKIMLKLNAGT